MNDAAFEDLCKNVARRVQMNKRAEKEIRNRIFSKTMKSPKMLPVHKARRGSDERSNSNTKNTARDAATPRSIDRQIQEW